MKKLFGRVESVFDIAYLAAAMVIGVILLCTAAGNLPRLLAGVMALVLSGGDSFHLIPRVAVIAGHDGAGIMRALGRGKEVTSVTMTVFYLLLYQIGLTLFGVSGGAAYIALYILAAARIVLCLLPQNRWTDEHPPVSWGILRNIPFLVMGILTMILFAQYGGGTAVQWMWLAILISFGCYLPVVIGAEKHPMLGMLMLPKTCAYLWILVMCLYL